MQEPSIHPRECFYSMEPLGSVKDKHDFQRDLRLVMRNIKKTGRPLPEQKVEIVIPQFHNNKATQTYFFLFFSERVLPPPPPARPGGDFT